MARSGSVRLTLEEDQASLWRSGGEARRAAAVSYGGEDMHFIAVEQRGDAAPSPAPPTTPPRKKIIVVDERKFVKPSDPRPRDANGNLAPPPDYQPRGERDTEFEGRGNFTEDVRAVAQALRINGVAGVKDLLAGMAPQRSRDVASRLAGDVVAKWDDMTERQRTALIAGRTMRRLAETTDDAERQAKLLKRADELEVIALPPDNPVDWIRAAAFGAKVQKPKIAHPTVANLKLETEPDGTVLMYRGQPAKERGLGQYTGRIWTTDLARALRNAPTGELYVVRVKPDELAQASPSSSRAGKVRADETRFTLSAELAKRGKRYDADAELMAKARQAAVGGVTNPGRGDVTETVRKRADKLTAGAIFQRLSAAADQPAVPHPAQPKMMLLQEADGHVLMFQGRNPEKTIGSTGERIYTTDVERAIRGANGGEVRVIRIPVDELEKARPRSGVNGRIDPAESVFVLDRDLAWKAELVEGAPDMLQAAVRQALELAPEAKYTRSMDDVEALIRLREVIEECKP